LYSASLTMTKLYKTVLTPLGLTYPQYLTLLALWEQDGQGVSELGEHLYLDSGTLTPLLKRMEASGWLVRRRSTDDERRVLVHLTPQGHALRSKARQVPRTLAARTGLDLAQVTQLTERLQRLREQLQGPYAPAHPDATSHRTAP
jgi:DNA-binding MarR family transcriptional regulator